MMKATDVVLDFERDDKNYQSVDIKRIFTGEKKMYSFIEYYREYLKMLERDDKIGSKAKANSVLNNLLKYINKKDVKFSELDYSFFVKYEKYMREKEPPMSINTVHSNLKQIRKLMYDAVRDGIIHTEKNPFNKFRIKLEDKEKIKYLELDELQRIEDSLFNDKGLEATRDIFILACYTGGLRVSDLLCMRAENFDGNHIKMKSLKTKRWLFTYVTLKAREILKKYLTGTILPKNYIFPFLRNNVNTNNSRELYNAISSAISKYNKALKKVVLKASVKKNLHSHIARHTFSTLALSKGIPPDYVSKILDHKNNTVTLGYAKYISKDLDKYMMRFNE